MAIRLWELYEENKEKFQLRIVAGRSGMDTVVGWVHMVEDETIVSRFKGEELAITTGMKTNQPDWLFHLIKHMHEADCAGIIVNVGMYIDVIPSEIIIWCEQNHFPILVMPWEKSITSLTQSFCLQIMDQKQYEKQIGATLMNAINGSGTKAEYEKILSNEYDINRSFQIICIYVRRQKDEEVLYTQSILKVENIFGTWKNTKKITTAYALLYVEDYLVLILNAMEDAEFLELPNLIQQSFYEFEKKKHLFIGIGPKVANINDLQVAYRRSKIAMKRAIDSQARLVDYESMGIYKILYSVDDTELLNSYATQLLKPILEYDALHHAGYLDTLRSYIINDRSLIKVSEDTFTHRNTVNYRVNNMKKLLNNEMKTFHDLFQYEVALLIYDMLHPSK